MRCEGIVHCCTPDIIIAKGGWIDERIDRRRR